MLRGNRDFRRLWTAQALSELGAQVSSLGYPLLVLFTTGSAADAGVVAATAGLTLLAMRLPAGALVDRWNCRTVMVVADAGRALALASLAVAIVTHHLVLGHILLVAFVEAVLTAFFSPAEIRMLNRVVAPDTLAYAVAVNQSRTYVVSVLAQPLGGLLFGVKRYLPFLVDALTYLVSLALVLSVRGARPEPAAPGGATRRPSLLREIGEGLRWLWRQPFLRAATVWLALVSAVFGAIGLVTLVIGYQLGATPAQIGLMYGMCGAGGVAGTLATPWLHRRFAPGRIIIAFGWTATAVAPLLAWASSIYLIGAIGAVAFFLLPPANALVLGYVVQGAPQHLHGRVSSVVRQAAGLAAPLGPLGAGLAVHAVGARPAVLLCAAVLLLLAVTATLLRTPPLLDGDHEVGSDKSDILRR
jgi:predicted MFS family arabinose efflux permease